MESRQSLILAILIHVFIPMAAAVTSVVLPAANEWQHFLPQGLAAYSLASLIRILWKDQVPNSWWLALSILCIVWGSIQSLILSTQTNFDLSELISCLIFATPVYFQQQNHSTKIVKTI